MLMVSAVIGVPLGLPVLLGLWVKQIYWKTYFVILGIALLPSIYFTYDQIQTGTDWSIQDRMVWLYLFGLIGLLIALPLWRFAHKAERERIDRFFVRMHTPVDFEKEVGDSSDHMQLRMIGVSSLAMACLVALLLLVPNTFEARLQILCMVGFMGGIGLLLLFAAKRRVDRQQASEVEPSVAVELP